MNRSLTVAMAAALLALGAAACGGGGGAGDAPRPLTLDEATLLASVTYDNYVDEGAEFTLSTAFQVSNDTLTLQGIVDWKHHTGRAIAVAKGAESGISEVYWTETVVLERRPDADGLLASMGYDQARFFARAPEPDKRLLDRAIALVYGLASPQRDNAQLILQKPDSSFLRTDTLRGLDAKVLRFGTRNVYWLDAVTNDLLRFEGDAEQGGAPTVIDITGRSPQTIELPDTAVVVSVDAVKKLYDALLQSAASPGGSGR